MAELLRVSVNLEQPGGPLRTRTYVGYGRDPDEARAHAGLDESLVDREQWSEVDVVDDAPRDSESGIAARAVCDFHADEDEDVPDEVKQALKVALMDQKWAHAVELCIRAVWDDLGDLDDKE